MARSGFKNGKDKRDAGGHVAVPLSVLNSAAYLGLNAYARMLLWDLAAQYRGDNNGDLSAAFKVMKPRGWKHEGTLLKAKRELLAAGLIFETRGCKNFCVNGHLVGNYRNAARRGNDRSKSITPGFDRQPVGRLQEA